MKYSTLKNFYLLLIINIIITIFLSVKPFLYSNVVNISLIYLTTLIFCIVLLVKNEKNKIVSPLLIYMFFYLFLYFFTPIYDILTNKINWFGVDVFPNSIMPLTYSFIGALFLFIGYKFTKVTNNKSVILFNQTYSFLILQLYFLFFISLSAISLYFIVTFNTNLLSIFSFGIINLYEYPSIQIDNIGFLSNLAYTMIPTTLLIYSLNKSKFTLILFIFLSLSIQFFWGFRFLIVQSLLSIFIYFLLTRKRGFGFFNFLFISLSGFILVTGATIFRDLLRSGGTIDLSSLSFNLFIQSLEDTIIFNFRVYKNYFGMVHVIPNQYNFVYLDQILFGTILIMIPRFIWPNKPYTGAGAPLWELLNSDLLRGTGQAYPNLGEYYFSFGLVGIIILMLISGYFIKKMNFFKNTNNKLFLSVYSSVIPVSLQFIIRGYMPTNFWLLIFTFFPYFVFLFNFKIKGILYGN